MSKRGWLLGLGGLILTGFLIACGSTYNASSNGLLLVGSQGSGIIETFAFSLNDGHISAIANSPNDTANNVCMLGSLPASMVVDPAGQYAYAILEANKTYCGANSQTGIATFQLKSDGNITQGGGLIQLQNNAGGTIPVVPSMLAMDSAGKFLFVADRATTGPSNELISGAVSVFSIGSGGSLTEVTGSPFYPTSQVTLTQPGLDIISVASTPTVFPQIGVNGTVNSVCSQPGLTAPTSEYLYAVDQLGNQIFEFQVDTSSGALTLITTVGGLATFPTDQLPAGIAVDPCNRFAYVSDSLSNKVSAYTICSAVLPQQSCPAEDNRLIPVAGSPFVMSGNANGPGPIAVDPYGNYVYVVGTLSNTVSGFKISPVTGALIALNPAVVQTGLRPTAMAIRKDDNWMFISNFDGNTVSQYSITPGSGALSAEAPIQTDNSPWGVAVK